MTVPLAAAARSAGSGLISWGSGAAGYPGPGQQGLEDFGKLALEFLALALRQRRDKGRPQLPRVTPKRHLVGENWGM
jgi:hypothetical protein